MGSLECLASRSQLVNDTQACGPVPPFEVSRLATRSTTLSRPILFHFPADHAEREVLVSGLLVA